MDAIFKKKKNIHPEILLSNESVDHLPEVHNITEVVVETPETTQVVTETPKRSRCSAVLNRNKILENMRKDRVGIKNKDFKSNKKNWKFKTKIRTNKERNKLIEERNDLLKGLLKYILFSFTNRCNVMFIYIFLCLINKLESIYILNLLP
ncbi:hypothetical protein NQ314_012905 [Rhamnusium bicolor]|uniref:Uncharacterized protein n=1 Tax=Rhamnusium bicolor TaxID=1586634 RepID=A0AAV8X9W9_9CUCU|nr:hypothetical protein NQ314_012905 [Rhamnusium bicolor]